MEGQEERKESQDGKEGWRKETGGREERIIEGRIKRKWRKKKRSETKNKRK